MTFHVATCAGLGGRHLSSAFRKLRTLCGITELHSLPSRRYSEGGRLDFMERNQLPSPTSAPADPSTAPHVPVMVEEVLGFLAQKDKSRVILDLTFGSGGHSRKLLEASPGVRLVCLDRDPLAYSFAQDLQQQYPRRVLPLLGRFSDLPTLLTRLKIEQGFFDGILMDLGVSSMQFDTSARGFMLSQDGPLDMRMDGARDPEQITAANVLSHVDEDSLYKVLKYYGEESHARILARALVESRYLFQRLESTKELANLVSSLVEGERRTDRLGRHAHPATKTFQALRILVNNELNELDYAMRLSQYYLRPSGVLVAISFHSLEDTIVKRHLQGVDLDQTPATIGLGVAKHRTALSTYSKTEMDSLTAKPWKSLTKHVVLPSELEVAANPRARSAKLRAALRV
ncbi:probable methyltransferase-like protein 15 homolog [Eriocheir sinensis]|uniref:probable methyltransferase-like protein 15 homolog n=1 Tax=Eriocheir sinensis TaxID=95602 RepID=UPI0021C92CB0|nr:probable methyltransferase-like protein 15 homolog [Eriocheir sinensis]